MMNALIVLFMMSHWKITFTKVFIMEPSEISKENILRTIKIPTITGCWVECQQITGCATIGSIEETKSEKFGFFFCHLLGIVTNDSKMNEDKDFIKVTTLRHFPVS